MDYGSYLDYLFRIKMFNTSFCRFCNLDKFETNYHLLYNCNKFVNLRDSNLEELNKKAIVYEMYKLDKWLSNSIDNFLLIIGIFYNWIFKF